MSNKLNIGELVASEMESLMASEEYRSLFKPSLTVTAAAKKKDEKEADKKKKCKCPPKCKCPGSKGEKCKCKAHRKEAMVEEVAETLAKVSEQLDEVNLSKTATAALQLITSLVAEAMDGCEVDDGDTAAADDGEDKEDSDAADDGEAEGDDNEARVSPGSSIDIGLSALDDDKSSELKNLIRDQKEDMDSDEDFEVEVSSDEESEDEDKKDEEDMDEYSLFGGDDGEEVGEGERALFSELEGLEDEDYSDDGLMASAASKDKDKEKAKKEKEKAKAQALKEKEKAAKEKAKEKAAKEKEKEKEKAAKEKEKAKKEKK